MKKKTISGLSLNKKTISNLNELGAIKGGSSSSRPSIGLCITGQTCIGDADCGNGEPTIIGCPPTNFVCPQR